MQGAFPSELSSLPSSFLCRTFFSGMALRDGSDAVFLNVIPPSRSVFVCCFRYPGTLGGGGAAFWDRSPQAREVCDASHHLRDQCLSPIQQPPFSCLRRISLFCSEAGGGGEGCNPKASPKKNPRRSVTCDLVVAFDSID